MRIRTLVFAAAFALPAMAAAQAPTDTPQQAPTTKTPPSSADQGTADTAKPDQSKTAKLTQPEIAIVEHMHHVNVMEIDGGKLARKQGSTAVKRYGDQMVRDHTTADKELTAFAKKRGLPKIGMPKPETEVEQQDQKAKMDAMAKLKSLKGPEFDREYLRMMVDDHEKELARSDVSIALVKDPDLKQMIENRKPMLQRHADAARNLQKGEAQASAPSKTPPSGTPGASTPTSPKQRK